MQWDLVFIPSLSTETEVNLQVHLADSFLCQFVYPQYVLDFPYFLYSSTFLLN